MPHNSTKHYMSAWSEGAHQNNDQIWPWISAATLITSMPWVLLLAMCVANAIIVYHYCALKRGIFVCYECLHDLVLSDYTAKESREVERGRGDISKEDAYESSSVIYDQVKGGGEYFAMMCHILPRATVLNS